MSAHTGGSPTRSRWYGGSWKPSNHSMKSGPKHLAFAIERVATQKGRFAARQTQLADMVQLFAQFAFVRSAWPSGTSVAAVNQAEGNARVAVIGEHRLAHQQFVEIGVNQRADNRVQLPAVVIDAGRDIHRSDQFQHPAARMSSSAPRPMDPSKINAAAEAGQHPAP